MTVVEMLTVILSVFAAWFALTRTGAVSRQYWLTHAAAFGCTITALGIGGTTQIFRDGIAATAGTSEASRAVAFTALVESAYRPLAIAVFGMLVFVALLRSASIGDAPDEGPAVGGVLARLTVFVTLMTLLGAVTYHVGFVFQLEEDFQDTMMRYTMIGSIVTVLVSAVAALWALFFTPTESDTVEA